jgi:hypothetical protein
MNAACSNISNFPTFVAGTCNGNGDGFIGPPSGDYTAPDAAEFGRFWNHLTNAKMIPGTYNCPMTYTPTHYIPQCAPRLETPSGMPATVLIRTGLGYIITTNIKPVPSKQDTRHLFMVGGTPVNGWATTPVWSAIEAGMIDAKYDDGDPWSGTITSLWNGGASYCGNAAGHNYMSSDTIGSPASSGCVLFFDLNY